MSGASNFELCSSHFNTLPVVIRKTFLKILLLGGYFNVVIINKCSNFNYRNSNIVSMVSSKYEHAQQIKRTGFGFSEVIRCAWYVSKLRDKREKFQMSIRYVFP